MAKKKNKRVQVDPPPSDDVSREIFSGAGGSTDSYVRSPGPRRRGQWNQMAGALERFNGLASKAVRGHNDKEASEAMSKGQALVASISTRKELTAATERGELEYGDHPWIARGGNMQFGSNLGRTFSDWFIAEYDVSAVKDNDDPAVFYEWRNEKYDEFLQTQNVTADDTDILAGFDDSAKRTLDQMQEYHRTYRRNARVARAAEQFSVGVSLTMQELSNIASPTEEDANAVATSLAMHAETLNGDGVAWGDVNKAMTAAFIDHARVTGDHDIYKVMGKIPWGKGSHMGDVSGIRKRVEAALDAHNTEQETENARAVVKEKRRQEKDTEEAVNTIYDAYEQHPEDYTAAEQQELLKAARDAHPHANPNVLLTTLARKEQWRTDTSKVVNDEKTVYALNSAIGHGTLTEEMVQAAFESSQIDAKSADAFMAKNKAAKAVRVNFTGYGPNQAAAAHLNANLDAAIEAVAQLDDRRLNEPNKVALVSRANRRKQELIEKYDSIIFDMYVRDDHVCDGRTRKEWKEIFEETQAELLEEFNSEYNGGTVGGDASSTTEATPSDPQTTDAPQADDSEPATTVPPAAEDGPEASIRTQAEVVDTAAAEQRHSELTRPLQPGDYKTLSQVALQYRGAAALDKLSEYDPDREFLTEGLKRGDVTYHTLRRVERHAENEVILEALNTEPHTLEAPNHTSIATFTIDEGFLRWLYEEGVTPEGIDWRKEAPRTFADFTEVGNSIDALEDKLRADAESLLRGKAFRARSDLRVLQAQRIHVARLLRYASNNRWWLAGEEFVQRDEASTPGDILELSPEEQKAFAWRTKPIVSTAMWLKKLGDEAKTTEEDSTLYRVGRAVNAIRSPAGTTRAKAEAAEFFDVQAEVVVEMQQKSKFLAEYEN